MTDTASGPDDARRVTHLTGLMAGVFLGGGMLAAVEALLVPRLRLTLAIDYAHVLLVQLVYYAGYLAFAVPATILVARSGAMRATAAGLAVMSVGSLALAVAASHGFAAMLAGLLLLSAGVTTLQIACNGVVATLGDRGAATARFTALQGLNSLGTVVGPLLAAPLLLGAGAARGVAIPFVGFALLFGGLACAFAVQRDLLGRVERDREPAVSGIGRVLRQPGVWCGAAAIFAYVGAEVTIGTLAASYLMLRDRLAASPVAAGRLVGLYWLGAMIGRFAGAWLLRRRSPSRMLAIASVAAVGCVAGAALLPGTAGSLLLLAVGLCNAIMFPTIYGLAMPPRASDVPAAAMLLCMAVVGGAAVPFATGLLADRIGLAHALGLPLLCYVGILGYARRGWTKGAR